MRVLVTGATGYIGGRLVPRLLEAGHQVTVLCRDRARIESRPWTDRVNVLVGDLLEIGPSQNLGQRFDVAFYLVHSMTGSADFCDVDRRCASNFVEATKGIGHVIYLGGLQPPDDVSTHLQSRAEVGQILAGGLPVTEFRAGPIIGSGSASFEMVRYLTERLPLMVTPSWVKNPVQPISIRAVLAYLIAAVERGPLGVVDIGEEALTFKQMMLGYAGVRGLRRTILPLPILAPGLAALWVGLVTPIPNSLAVPLVRGMCSPVLADTTRARELFPEVSLCDYATACQRAVEKTSEEAVETRWSSSLQGRDAFQLKDRRGMVREVRKLRVDVSPERLFRAFTSMGGERGWLVWQWAWRVRGFVDQLLGGPGLRRGRRHPTELLPGEALDFWRVEKVEEGRSLTLRAEMKVPGKAWLVWEAEPDGEATRLVQTALFQPKGLAGFLYWYLLYPIHGWIFSDMAQAVARLAEHEGA